MPTAKDIDHDTLDDIGEGINEDAEGYNPNVGESDYFLMGGIVRCSNQSVDDGDNGLVSVIVLRDAKYENDLKVKIKLGAETEILAKKFKAGEHFRFELRRPPLQPDGAPVNLLLDGEIASAILFCAEKGQSVPNRKDGDRIAILKFGLFPSDEDERPFASINKAGVGIRVEGVWPMSVFELGDPYRLVILPPPQHVKDDQSLKSGTVDDTPLGGLAKRLKEAGASMTISTPGMAPVTIGEAKPKKPHATKGGASKEEFVNLPTAKAGRRIEQDNIVVELNSDETAGTLAVDGGMARNMTAAELATFTEAYPRPAAEPPPAPAGKPPKFAGLDAAAAADTKERATKAQKGAKT